MQRVWQGRCVLPLRYSTDYLTGKNRKILLEQVPREHSGVSTLQLFIFVHTSTTPGSTTTLHNQSTLRSNGTLSFVEPLLVCRQPLLLSPCPSCGLSDSLESEPGLLRQRCHHGRVLRLFARILLLPNEAQRIGLQASPERPFPSREDALW